MKFTGVLKKMITEGIAPVQYFLDLEEDVLHINQLLGKKFDIQFDHFQCMACGMDKPIFRQGHCKSCFFEQPQTADWIMRPELSKAHLGQEDRDLDYEKQVQLQPHIVYLAHSSHVKVGVTRKNQIPTRWIDQGAHEAIEILEVPNRYLAGIAEVALKNHVSDKTNWRHMLTNQVTDEDLFEWRTRLIPFLPKEVFPYILENQKEMHISYPVLRFPTKVMSLNLSKKASYQGVLMGIKGQYLLFEDQTVFNVRSHEGFVVNLDV